MRSLRKSSLLILIIVFGATLAIVPAQAQSVSHVSVNIPFEFSVGNNLLKAGNYRIEILSSRVLAFDSSDGQQHQFVLAIPGDAIRPGGQPRLVFVRYGDKAFLHQVISADDDYAFVPSKQEKKLIQEYQPESQISLLVEPVL